MANGPWISNVGAINRLCFLAVLCSLLLMDMTATAALTRGAVVAATERLFLCSDGVQLAAQHWTFSKKQTETRVLCLHGWLDNSQSFHRLAPSLHMGDAEIIALDFPGHGLSSHKSPDSPPTVISDAAFYVAEAVRLLKWDSFVLLGHSMGAAVSLIYAASFPEQVSRLILLEGAGPLTRKPRDTSKHVRASIERRQTGNPFLYPQFNNYTKKEPRIYPNVDAAVETRCKTATLAPGHQSLSREASMAMVERATIAHSDGSGVMFRHDPRLQWPSLQYMSDEQVEGLYKDIHCPVCLLVAQDGWPVEEARTSTCVSLLQPIVFKTLPGSHHFHADPESSDLVADEVLDFIRKS